MCVREEMTTDLQECEKYGTDAERGHVAMHVLGNHALHRKCQCQLGSSMYLMMNVRSYTVD